MFRSQGTAGIPVLALSVQAGKGAAPLDKALTYTFSSLSVGSFTEDSLSGALSATATLSARAR